MSACTFFGHSDCYGLDEDVLRLAIEELIRKGVDTFYVGNHGQFDGLVFRTLREFEKVYPNISVSVVLAYLPTQKNAPYQGYDIFPEGMESGPRRFAIERRNNWMIRQAKGGYCLCYITHTWGSACKFAKRAKSQGVRVINLGTLLW